MKQIIILIVVPIFSGYAWSQAGEKSCALSIRGTKDETCNTKDYKSCLAFVARAYFHLSNEKCNGFKNLDLFRYDRVTYSNLLRVSERGTVNYEFTNHPDK